MVIMIHSFSSYSGYVEAESGYGIVDSRAGKLRRISFDGICPDHVISQAQYDFRSEADQVDSHKQAEIDPCTLHKNLKNYVRTMERS